MAGIYIHIPFCRSKCRYCDFVSYPTKLGFADAYMACVLKEMQFRAKDLQGKSFDTVYFGGGTPSVIDAKWITGCMNQIRACFRLSEKAEVTIELNPGTVDAAKVEAYKKAGVNRFSVGLQSALSPPSIVSASSTCWNRKAVRSGWISLWAVRMSVPPSRRRRGCCWP